MRLLLDTNANSALTQGDEAAAATVRNADELLLSIVVIGALAHYCMAFTSGFAWPGLYDPLSRLPAL